MKPGALTHRQVGKIEYRQLRKINPEAARRAVIGYLKSKGHNVPQTALIFGINRTVVYDIIRKDRQGDLRDRSKTPKHQPNKTSALVEDKVLEAKNKTRLGPERLSRYLKGQESSEQRANHPP